MLESILLSVNQSVLSVSRQLEYLKHYKIHLGNLVGVKKAVEIIGNSIFLLSMGTNDFLQNYYLEPTRSRQYTVEQYENYLVSSMFEDIKVLALSLSLFLEFDTCYLSIFNCALK